MQSIVEDIKNQFAYGSMVTRLILINIFVYIADNVLHLLFFLISLPHVYDSFMNWLMVTASLRELGNSKNLGCRSKIRCYFCDTDI